MGRTMGDKELKEFIGNPNITSLFVSRVGTAAKINSVCSTLVALGYDGDWARENVRHALIDTYDNKQ